MSSGMSRLRPVAGAVVIAVPFLVLECVGYRFSHEAMHGPIRGSIGRTTYRPRHLVGSDRTSAPRVLTPARLRPTVATHAMNGGREMLRMGGPAGAVATAMMLAGPVPAAASADPGGVAGCQVGYEAVETVKVHATDGIPPEN